MSQLDLYNQRIMEKREQQYKERLTRKKEEKNTDGVLISPGITNCLITNNYLSLTGIQH